MVHHVTHECNVTLTLTTMIGGGNWQFPSRFKYIILFITGRYKIRVYAKLNLAVQYGIIVCTYMCKKLAKFNSMATITNYHTELWAWILRHEIKAFKYLDLPSVHAL